MASSSDCQKTCSFLFHFLILYIFFKTECEEMAPVVMNFKNIYIYILSSIMGAEGALSSRWRHSQPPMSPTCQQASLVTGLHVSTHCHKK